MNDCFIEKIYNRRGFYSPKVKELTQMIIHFKRKAVGRIGEKKGGERNKKEMKQFQN